MRPRLYTEIPRDGENWRFVRSGPSGLEPVPEGAGIPSGADVVVFVPGTEVTGHRVRAAAHRAAPAADAPFLNRDGAAPYRAA